MFFDQFGHSVNQEEVLLPGEHTINIPSNSFQNGILNYIVEMGENSYAGSLIKH